MRVTIATLTDFSTLTFGLHETKVRPSKHHQLGGIYAHKLQSLDGLVLNLCAMNSGKCYPWGSAVFVNPGIALTAKHIIDEFQRRISEGFIDTPLVAFGPSSSGLRAWTVKSVVSPSTGDICILTIEPCYALGEREEFRCPSISRRLPSVGEFVVGGCVSTKTR